MDALYSISTFNKCNSLSCLNVANLGVDSAIGPMKKDSPSQREQLYDLSQLKYSRNLNTWICYRLSNTTCAEGGEDNVLMRVLRTGLTVGQCPIVVL